MDQELVVSKASLITLSHAFEAACLHERDPDRLVLACFQHERHFRAERDRYARIAESAGATVVLHSGEPTDDGSGITELRIPPGHPLLSAWDVVVVAPTAGAALICEDLGRTLQSEPVPDRDRAFLARWSFDRHAAAGEARAIVASLDVPERTAARVETLLDRATAVPTSDAERQMAVAFDHLVRSLESANLHARAAGREAERNKVLAERDELTGALNRTFLASFHRRQRRDDDGPLAAILLDLDRFKQVNDELGHAAGDEVLRAVAGELRAAVRAPDLVVRWGGDEFLLLLPGTELDDAHTRAEHLRERLTALRFGPPLTDYTVSASLGVALLDGDVTDISVVDEAMYAAKRGQG